MNCEPHLPESPISGADFEEHPERDAEHGGQTQEPAHHVAPPRVHILLIVLQWSVLDQGERKSALQTDTLCTKYYFLKCQH